jgi:hypothetical protein
LKIEIRGKYCFRKIIFIKSWRYKENEFEEYHYKILAVAESFEMASKKPKQLPSTNIAVSTSYFHIDDKYGIDVDDIYNVDDILDAKLKEKYCLKSPNLKLYLKKILYIRIFKNR